ncbi:MAG TPA: DUF4837 family protein [Paludibacteraceae bacterium]|nr:DUF4837 family protein [Paludibacteraceae bacterium]
MKKIFLPLMVVALALSSCGNSSVLLPNATGAAFEVLVVIDEKDWRSEGGKALFDVLAADMPCIPQAEPMFSISRVPQKEFDNLLRPTRNIVMVVIDSTQYTKSSIKFIKNRWANSQAIVLITSDTPKSLANLLTSKGDAINNYFVEAERLRQIEYLKSNINNTALNKVYNKFGAQMAIPSSLNKYNEAPNFLWISNGSATARQDVIIYSYPYTDKKQLTKEALLTKRDSILKAHIPGSFKGSYMGTAYAYEPPVFREIWRNNSYCAEICGLWEMKHGEIMGGPFINHTRLDEINNRLISIEGFVFAPSRDKRNLIRQMEAMVYSFKMPQEVNEVVITPKK